MLKNQQFRCPSINKNIKHNKDTTKYKTKEQQGTQQILKD